MSEALRLEKLWGGTDFGDDYTERTSAVEFNPRPFWKSILAEFPTRRALEVGCNVGDQIGAMWDVEERYGIDVNRRALDELQHREPEVNALRGVARDLPFRDRWFDLVFTMGVLIHQPPETLPLVMAEIVRCSRRWVLCGEYFSETPVEVPYRGQAGALFKRDFGGMYLSLFPELQLRKTGFLSGDGWDDVTYWVMEKA